MNPNVNLLQDLALANTRRIREISEKVTTLPPMLGDWRDSSKEAPPESRVLVWAGDSVEMAHYCEAASHNKGCLLPNQECLAVWYMPGLGTEGRRTIRFWMHIPGPPKLEGL